MSMIFHKDDLDVMVRNCFVERKTDIEIKKISKEIFDSLSFDGNNIQILSDPESLAREVLFITNEF
jgi:hypothetical protein